MNGNVPIDTNNEPIVEPVDPRDLKLQEATNVIKRLSRFLELATVVFLFAWPLIVFIFYRYIDDSLQKIEKNTIALARLADLEGKIDNHQGTLNKLVISSATQKISLDALKDLPNNVAGLSSQSDLQQKQLSGQLAEVQTNVDNNSSAIKEMSNQANQRFEEFAVVVEKLEKIVPKVSLLEGEFAKSNQKLAKFVTNIESLQILVDEINSSLNDGGSFYYTYNITRKLKDEFELPTNVSLPVTLEIPSPVINPGRSIVGVSDIGAIPIVRQPSRETKTISKNDIEQRLVLDSFVKNGSIIVIIDTLGNTEAVKKKEIIERLFKVPFVIEMTLNTRLSNRLAK